jgi:hypothetical protein
MMPNTDNRHIISIKSQGFYQTPQEMMEEYNGCSVPQYTAYPLNNITTMQVLSQPYQPQF